MELIKKTNLSEAVYKRLLGMIKVGELNPGDRLPSELKLCKMLGVSRTALREGVKSLAVINVLAIIPGRGTFVNEDPDLLVADDALNVALERATIESIYEVRSVLDTGLARYAALKATQEDIRAMGSAQEKMARALEFDPMDSELAVEADEAFHFALCEASHNKVLEKVAWPIVNHAMLRRSKKIGFTKELIIKALDTHQRILEAIKDRNPENATAEMEKHLKMAFETFYLERGVRRQ